MRHIHSLITPYVYVFGMASQTASVYLTVAVTVERYVSKNWFRLLTVYTHLYLE